MKTIVIIPTFNERENIKKIIPAIRAVDKKIHVLVIDDASPDGTAAEVMKMAKSSTGVKLIKRDGKLGLGTAYVEGFKYALKHKYDYIFEMDADFSHDPKYIPLFLEEIKKI